MKEIFRRECVPLTTFYTSMIKKLENVQRSLIILPLYDKDEFGTDLIKKLNFLISFL